MYYHNDGIVKWLGGFGQVEYNYAFHIYKPYRFTNHVKLITLKQDLVLSDTILVEVIGINDTIITTAKTMLSNPMSPFY